ncbi:MAG: hypothetical protein RI953_2672 [Pseudomonadota bacterium]
MSGVGRAAFHLQESSCFFILSTVDSMILNFQTVFTKVIRIFLLRRNLLKMPAPGQNRIHEIFGCRFCITVGRMILLVRAKLIVPALFLMFSACVPKFQRDSVSASAGEITNLEDRFVSAGLVELRGGIETDLAYAKDDPTGKINFLKKNVYGNLRKCFLQKEIAAKLNSAQIILKRNLGPKATLVMYDCARPRSVQEQMWKILPDSRYVANPVSGSNHNFGASVDLSFRDATGVVADMGVRFDHFGPEAAFIYPSVSQVARKNRLILRETLQQAGLFPYDAEWWHFDGVANPRSSYKILDF